MENSKRRVTMKKRILCALGLALLLTGCGSSSYDSSASNKAAQTMAASDMMTEEAADEAASEGVYEYDAVAQNSDTGSGASTAENVQKQVEQGRKLIRRMDIGVETQSFDELLSQIDAKVAELGGYIESSNTYGSSYGYEGNRSANYTVRVPADKMDEMVTMVSENANVTRKSESTDDVTLSYVDTKSRKEALEVEQERLMADGSALSDPVHGVTASYIRQSGRLCNHHSFRGRGDDLHAGYAGAEIRSAAYDRWFCNKCEACTAGH